MSSYDIEVRTSARHAGDMLADRELGHRQVMQLWGHQPDTSTPRADLGVLWTVTAADLATDHGLVLVRANTVPAAAPAWCRSITPHQWAGSAPQERDTVTCRIQLEAQKSPRVPVSRQVEQQVKAGANGQARSAGEGLCWRPNRVAVPDDELHPWLTRKLGRHGLALEHAEVHGRFMVRLPGRGGGYHAVTATLKGTITDPTAWHQAITDGIGKGKAFGLGMLLHN